MAARAMWKGVIRLDRIMVPVKFYAAVIDQKVHFRLLHKADQVPVEQRMVHPRDNQSISADGMLRGYETAEGRIVILDPAELAGLEPKPSREIRIMRFIDSDRLPFQWFDRPYYLGPDESDDLYFALAEALANENKKGIAVWTMRGKEYIGALSARNGYLMMIALRHVEEIIDITELPYPPTRKLEPREKLMAEQLVHAMEGAFELDAYKETYRDRLLGFIQRKAEGVKSFPERSNIPKPKNISLADGLQKSLEKVQKERKSA